MTIEAKYIIHGHARRGQRTPEHRSWHAMIDRCEQPTHISFKYYGARGIKVCARWRHSFAAFLADMGGKPSPRHTIDRKDSDGDYEPNNCQWATAREQRLNQRPQDDSARVQASWDGGKRSRVSKGRADMIARRFGRLVVLAFAETRDSRAYWACRCDCGELVTLSGKSLRNGTTKSCGCLKHDATAWSRAIA